MSFVEFSILQAVPCQHFADIYQQSLKEDILPDAMNCQIHIGLAAKSITRVT